MKRYKQSILPHLFRNKLATASLIVIIIFCLVAILGYAIMPDSTPNANDGVIQLRKRTPGFKATLLKTRKTIHISSVSFFQKLANGKENEYNILPIEEYRIEGMMIYAKLFEENSIEKRISLVSAVYPLYPNKTESFETNEIENYKIEGEKITYLDYNQEIKQTTKTELLNEFKKNNIEKRKYWLGTDLAGRDLLSRIIFGTRISVSIGLVAVIISLLIGTTLGALAGFLGGFVDKVVMWVVTVFWSIPSTMLVIAISLALQSRGIVVAFIAVGLTTWVDIARMVRGEILSIKEKPYIEAARAFGIGNFQIVTKHVLPNIMSSLVVVAAANFASAILIEAGLSFLGLSVQPPTPSWGMMINEGFKAIASQGSWHLIVFPSLAVSVLVLCFNLLGSGLRDAYDPRSIIIRNSK